MFQIYKVDIYGVKTNIEVVSIEQNAVRVCRYMNAVLKNELVHNTIYKYKQI